jgi:phosphoribosylanthranilate isomerase
MDRQVRSDAGEKVAESLRGSNFRSRNARSTFGDELKAMPQSLITPGWIKVCGIRDVVTAQVAASSGASAIGLNFFGKSPRSITPDLAREIVGVLAETSTRGVGLFVNHSQDEIETIAIQTGLSAIQLHGDESATFVADLQRRHPDWAILKAFRIGDCLQPMADFIAECVRLNVSLAGCLLDARVDGTFGGTGKLAPWELIARDYDRTRWPPLILAGGLTADNVAEAIRAVRPDGVDTASGVELSPGVKDTTLIARFVAEARHAFANLGAASPPPN